MNRNEFGEFGAWIMLVPYIICLGVLLIARPDVDGSGAFTISDLWQGGHVAFVLPGITLVQSVQGSPIGEFFEVSSWTEEGQAIAGLSILLWILFGAVFGVSVQRVLLWLGI